MPRPTLFFEAPRSIYYQVPSSSGTLSFSTFGCKSGFGGCGSLGLGGFGLRVDFLERVVQAAFGSSFLPAASVTSPTEVRVRVQGLGFREVYGLRLGVGPQRQGRSRNCRCGC